MRDFYDVHILLYLHEKDIDTGVLAEAFQATCKKRGTEDLQVRGLDILQTINDDETLRSLWAAYQKKYSYASDIQYENVIKSVRLLLHKIQHQ